MSNLPAAGKGASRRRTRTAAGGLFQPIILLADDVVGQDIPFREGSMQLTGNCQSPAGDGSPAKVVQIEVVRVEAGASEIFRILSPKYGGLFTHYKARSRYCPGEDFCQLHRLDRVWKGYCAAEWWLRKEKAWRPCVLEITESLELDMRDFFTRGQIWEIWKEQKTSKKAPQVNGKMQELCDVNRLRPDFDYRPVLQALYHVDAVDLSKKNPCAARILMQDSHEEPPAFLGLKESKPITEAEWEAMKKKHEDLFRRDKKSPTDRKKGQGLQ